MFGKHYVNKRSKYFSLRKNLMKSRINIGYDRYLSGVLLMAILSTLLMSILFNALLAIIPLPDISGIALGFPVWTAKYAAYKLLALRVFGGIGFAVLCFSSIYYFAILYPAIVASDRKRKIEQMLPYGINYMSAMSGAGVLPVDLFRSLASNEIYGEVAVEARYLVRDLEVLGYNLVSAMKNLAASTPSPMMQEFLQGSITVVTSGGDLEPYFKIKADQYLIDNRQRQKEFLETLGLMGETYVTAFVAGPLFLIVVISIVALMGGADFMFLYLMVYGLIPIGTLMFIVLVSAITPEE
ncbi:secretion system protein [Methanococcoides methylutens]|uniref:Secretion system protein n=1 Tax=Methanococcoides methylutens TaxID=2226 RepID=A0A099T171_METMT|nr:secretion system protein [Methanococcoides methylutens]